MFKSAIFCAMLSLASAATFLSYLPEKPEHLAHKEGCYIEEIGDVIPFGSTITGPECVRITCGGMIDYASCGVVMTSDPKCYVTKGDHSKQYPDCCPNVECERDNFVEPNEDEQEKQLIF